jgi:8-oxo-dGTP pyrophosphatase MutT (NUDIX family)
LAPLAVIAQAGGVVFKPHGTSCLVLLVRARKNPQLWIFPKGHIEDGETAREAAVRETREEAGVDGRVVDHIFPMQFESPRGIVEVEYYLLEWTKDVPSSEERERKWCALDEARLLVEFDGARDLLTAAARKWDDDRASRVP